MLLKDKYLAFFLLIFSALVANAASNDYLISADTVIISDQTKTLGGDIYGNVLEIGADTKIYGNVSANAKCFLRERASISGTMSFPAICTKQNGISIGKEISRKTKYAPTEIGSIPSGSQNDGPVRIYVLDGVRLADRNTFSITGGNPSEIEWIVASGSIDIGTDGKFFGRFIAPNSRVRLAPRSHVIGGIEASHFQMEPQSTVSMEPRAEEISHSEYNFGPFYDKNTFRYRSALPISISSLEMYVYAQGLGVKVDGNASRSVKLEKTSQKVSVAISRPFIADFPAEAFSSIYEFSFSKTQRYRIYWNPYSPCVSNCDGNAEETALRSFAQALAEAQGEGLEINFTYYFTMVKRIYKFHCKS